MEKKESCCNRWNNIPTIIRSILFIDLTSKATNVVEKLFWLTIGLMGVVWVGVFMTALVTQRNTVTVRNYETKLSELKYPAMTICSKASTKYAIAERMGNYLNGNFEKLKHVLKIFAVAITFMKPFTKKTANDLYKGDYWHISCTKITQGEECKV